MNPLAFVSSLLALTCFSLALFIFKISKNSLHRLWAYFNCSVGIWGAGICFAALSKTQTDAFMFWRIAHSGGFFVSVLFYHVARNFCNLKERWLLRFFYFEAIFFFCLNLFGITGYEVRPTFGEIYYVKISSFIYIFVTLFWFIPVIVGHVVLFRAHSSAVGKRRNQIKYLLLSMLIGFSGGAQHFLPVYNVNIYPYGNLLITVYTLLATYAIFRHKLLDIEVIIRRTIVFAGLLIAVVAAIASPVALVQIILGNALGIINPFVLMILGVATTIFIYRPVEKWLVNLTDKYLFQKPYDYHKVLKDAARGMSKIESLSHLLRLVLHFVTMKMRVENAIVLSFNREAQSYHVVAARGFKSGAPRIALGEDHPLITLLRARNDAVLINEGDKNVESNDLRYIQEELKQYHSQVAIPSFLGKDLKNILLIGEKKSGETYTTEDLSLLFTLAQESAIAIENARLYDQAVERSRELSAVNKELTNANEKLKVTQATLIVAEKNATMVGMAKAIGHEVNNPLSTVGGRAVWIYQDELKKCREAVQKNASLLPENLTKELEKRFSNIEDNAHRIEKSARRIEIVIKTLTDILKDTKGERGPLSLLVLCREAREATRFLTYDENLSGCQIVENIASNVIIFGNLEQLLQVFINLIKNAYEAMVGQQKERQIEMKGVIDPSNPKMARIEFIDNGPGIEPDALPKIWGQGFSTKEKKEDHIGAAGQGQGLFVCKHVIESIHGGEIFAESTIGIGTTFVIRLPLADMES